MIFPFDTFQRSKKSYGRAMEPVCRKWELTRNELDVLLFLANNPEYDRAADIVERRGIAKSHVSLAVQSLTARNLLEQRFDHHDRRCLRLRLTEQGQLIAREGRGVQREYFTKVFAGLTQEELDLWESITKRVCQNIAQLDE